MQFIIGFDCMEPSTLLSSFFFSFFKDPYPSFGCRENRGKIDRGRNFHDHVLYFLLVFLK